MKKEKLYHRCGGWSINEGGSQTCTYGGEWSEGVEGLVLRKCEGVKSLIYGVWWGRGLVQNLIR